jgi:lycopene cyclase domain-containing protein
MFWEYSLYILSIVLGTSLMDIVLKLNPIRKLKLLISSILSVAVIFVAWDIFAAYRDFWSFNVEHMLGLIFVNQPLEEVSFFLAVPFYYIAIWELAKRVW